MFRPTDEQQIAVERFLTGRPLKIAAFAGAGKTTTLGLLAEARSARGVYLAFNKSIAAAAAQKFPRSVDCRTTHAMAFRAVMPRYGSTAKMTRNLNAKQLAEEMRYNDRVFPGSIRLNGDHQAHLVLGTVRRFCQSGDRDIRRDHVPKYGRLLGARDEVVAEIRGWALQQANVLWARMLNATDSIPLGHDGYLKVWSLARPKIGTDYILLDEAQDTNAVVLSVLEQQDAQVVYVGDRHQQIYEWRGAVNAMEKVSECEEASLTQSFRFGDQIAATASRVLATLGETKRIQGNPGVTSTISAAGRSEAVLARTNATVILEVLEATGAGQRPCVCGGTKEIKRLLSDVYELKKGKPGVSPEFFGFQKWVEVVEFADSEEGQSLRTFVQLVEQHGESKLWAAVSKAVETEDVADVILSTAHKAKGREWNSVRLAPDFMSARLGPDPDAESEVRLFYVAMTRAKTLLIADPEMLRVFTTEAWKRRQAEPASRRFPSSAPNMPPPRPKPRPGPPPMSRPVVNVREITPPSVSMRHPGAATGNFSVAPGPSQPGSPRQQSNVPPAPGTNLAPEQGSFWSRVARLFGVP